MKILAIGGSYFLGLVFTKITYQKHDITLVNRGNVSLAQFGIKEYKLERHDVDKIKSLPAEDYDAIVDFCAYKEGDIKLFIENFPGTFKRYIFVSTVDVYERNVNYVKDEKTPFSSIRYGGEQGDYIYKKILLEHELVEACEKKNAEYISIRPATIYGPYNYAPRESVLIRQIVNGGEIIQPTDADGKFQLVYVKDVANAILKVCEAKDVANSYNVCPEKAVDYNELIQVLKQIADVEVKVLEMPLEQAMLYSMLLPFPVTKQETELYSGEKIAKELNLSYTTLNDGMKITYNFFKK